MANTTIKKVSTSDIYALVDNTIKGCYGIKDVADLLVINGRYDPTKKGKRERGILVNRKSDNTFALDIYLILAQGIKVTETLRESQKRLFYVFSKEYPNLCRTINVYAVDLQ